MKKASEKIPGIYNYCDRWCERCSFTSRCAVYEGNKNISLEQQDINNEAFWEHLSKNFVHALKMLHEAAKEQGIDLNEVADSEESKGAWKKKKKERKQLEQHALFVTGMEYLKMTDAWMDKHETLQQKGKELISQMEMGVKSEKQTEQEAVSILDCLEIVRWYCHFIAVKFMRALSGREDDDKWFEENNIPKDSDGSAKIALIAVERSMASWGELYRQFGENEEDNILKMLAMLEKLKRIGEKEFPNARKFVRPGFDA